MSRIKPPHSSTIASTMIQEKANGCKVPIELLMPIVWIGKQIPDKSIHFVAQVVCQKQNLHPDSESEINNGIGIDGYMGSLLITTAKEDHLLNDKCETGTEKLIFSTYIKYEIPCSLFEYPVNSRAYQNNHFLLFCQAVPW